MADFSPPLFRVCPGKPFPSLPFVGRRRGIALSE